MTQQQRMILLAGILFLFTGSSFVAFEQWKFSNLFGRFVETGTNPADPALKREEARADLRKAEEYLRQNSRESARLARDIFNDILSRDLGDTINFQAKYGLAASLDRLDDRRAALAHLRKLKEAGIPDRALADKTDYLLGRLMILYGKEEEGKSLLEALLARTTDNAIKSKIHTTFGDNYAIRGNEKKARQNYIIALEYNPDNLHAEIARIEDLRDKRYFRYEYYDDYMLGRFRKDNKEFHSVDDYRTSKARPEKHTKPKKKHVNTETKDKDKHEKEEQGPSAIELYKEGILKHREGSYAEAVEKFTLALSKKPGEDLTEKILYWRAQSLLSDGNADGALAGFQEVLRNKDLKLDQAAYLQSGIIYFDSSEFEKALKQFSKAVDDFPSGEYTDRAVQWKREAENQIRERMELEKY